MSENSKQIQDWQDKVRQNFGDAHKLQEYLFETLRNFYYRYLETADCKGLETQDLGANRYGAYSFESNMVEALKTKNTLTRGPLIEFAKANPKSTNPKVRYGLWVEVKELKSERGELAIVAEVNWDFPNFVDSSKGAQKKVQFKYDDLAVFRKELALKLEEACELFY